MLRAGYEEKLIAVQENHNISSPLAGEIYIFLCRMFCGVYTQYMATLCIQILNYYKFCCCSPALSQLLPFMLLLNQKIAKFRQDIIYSLGKRKYNLCIACPQESIAAFSYREPGHNENRRIEAQIHLGNIIFRTKS